MTDLIRKGAGQPLRDAMRRRGLTQAALAAKTKGVDASGRGVSLGTIIKITGRGKYGADRCRERTARLIAAALGEPVNDHFLTPSVSTDTVER
ncbi:helix-turn-helix transcriptional regulator [Streptomyces sp. 5-8]|uniref:Helix-turn-helix transcriptional regulator n=1 Tax=Streptomyces musisoli TaxID=2802280 RepID=A0ABS1P4U9_9ACTN|nr:helix-turn-helix transcriptional regulator [Streptomyces musisoli]MBL1107391.1 helix-turn-helix transcriptional regulator [Streptomyces musisoli]